MKQLSLWFALFSCALLAVLLPESCTKENGVPDQKNLSKTSVSTIEKLSSITAAPDPAIAYAASQTIKRISTTNLWVMNADGSNQTPIVTWGGSMGRPSWFPDGQHIMFWGAAKAGAAQLMYEVDVSVINGKPTGSNVRNIPITNIPSIANSMELSPRGDQVALCYNSSIYTVSSTGGTATLVYTPPSGRALWPNWSATGDTIVFTENDNAGNWSMKIIDLTTLYPYTVTTVISSSPTFMPRFEVWSHHGDRIIFDGGNPNSTSPHATYTVSINSNGIGAPVKIADAALTPFWSPDDSKFVYLDYMGSIDTYDFSVGTKKQLVGSNANAAYPAWRSF